MPAAATLRYPGVMRCHLGPLAPAPLLAALVLAALALPLLACGTSVDDTVVLVDLAGRDAAVPDMGQPPDLARSPDWGLENAACEAALAAAWKAKPPTTGIGPPQSTASYDQVIGKIMADYGVPGGAVAVSKDGRLVLARGYGFADLEQQQPAHPDQLFRLASVSKQITAAAVLRLVAAGKLSLDEPAFAIVSDLKPLPGKVIHPRLASITVRHLLNHTGGWNRDFEAVGDPMFDSIAIAAALAKPGPALAEDVIRFMLDKAPTYAPGSTYCYSNFGYAVLGRIVERRGGAPYGSYVQKDVLGPAGATRARLGRSLLADRADDEVRYYPFPGEGMATSVFASAPGLLPWEYGGWAIEAMDAHGGWIASAVDILRFALTVDGLPQPPDLIDAGALAQMLANPHVPSCTAAGGTTPADPNYWYGFGWSVNSYGNHWHTGSLDGTSTEDVSAGNGFSWAALFNTRPRDAGGFASRLDGDLWTALGGVQGWTTSDYSDQFPAAGLSAWRSQADFANEKVAREAAGSYAVRVEGRRGASGGFEFRAEWAPRHGGAITMVDMDCLNYRSIDDSLGVRGLLPVAIQSFADDAGRRHYQATWASYH